MFFRFNGLPTVHYSRVDVNSRSDVDAEYHIAVEAAADMVSVSNMEHDAFVIKCAGSDCSGVSTVNASAYSAIAADSVIKSTARISAETARIRYVNESAVYGRFNLTAFNRRLGYLRHAMGASDIDAEAYRLITSDCDISSGSGMSAVSYGYLGVQGEIHSSSGLSAAICTPVWAEASIAGIGSLNPEVYRVRYANHVPDKYGRFNGTGFNRRNYRIGLILGFSDLCAAATVESNASAKLQSRAYFDSAVYRPVNAQSLLNSAAAASSYPHAIRRCAAVLQSEAFMTAHPHIIGVEIISFHGLVFKPGDTVTIDLCNYYAEQNGQNIMDKYNGTFFRLYAGDNVITWSDNVSTRKIEMKITYKNRFL